jgi:hypothetical protein
MPSPHDAVGIESWLCRLLEAGDPAARDRVLLDAVSRSLVAQAAAVWRAIELGPERPHEWIAALSRGSDALLPDRRHLEAVETGDLAAELPHGRRIIIAPGSMLALALGGVSLERELDDLTGLLWVAAAIEGQPRDGSMDALRALLPDLRRAEEGPPFA